MKKYRKHYYTQLEYSQDIGMIFDIEIYAILVTKRAKRHLNDGMELANQDKIRTLGEKKANMYLGILKANTSNKWR